MVGYDYNPNTFEKWRQEDQEFKLTLVYLYSESGGQPEPRETLSERGSPRDSGKEKDTWGWGDVYLLE